MKKGLFFAYPPNNDDSDDDDNSADSDDDDEVKYDGFHLAAAVDIQLFKSRAVSTNLQLWSW